MIAKFDEIAKIGDCTLLTRWGTKKEARLCDLACILIFMPPPLGAGGIMFSGCPSVRPKPEIPSFDLYMGPLVHPTNCKRFTACPSVRLSGEVSGDLPENAWRD